MAMTYYCHTVNRHMNERSTNDYMQQTNSIPVINIVFQYLPIGQLDCLSKIYLGIPTQSQSFICQIIGNHMYNKMHTMRESLL